MPESRENKLQELGKEIRRRREDLGLSLNDVYEGTKIRTQFLEGIERGDFSEFPGTVYIRGFIRSYLQFIGAEDFWGEYLPVLSEGIQKKKEEEPVVGSCAAPAKGFKPASRFWIFAILLLVLLGSSWYVWYTWDQNGAPSFALRTNGGDTAAKSEERVETITENGVSAQTDEKPSGSSSAVNTKVNGEQDAQGEGNGSGGTAGQIAVSAPGGKAPPTAAELVGANVPADAPAAVEKKDMELVIAADGDCWIRVRQGTKTLYERTVRAGETISFSVKERIEVTYGRAGAVRTRWNGESLGNPGTAKGVERVFYAPDGKTGRIAR